MFCRLLGFLQCKLRFRLVPVGVGDCDGADLCSKGGGAVLQFALVHGPLDRALFGIEKCLDDGFAVGLLPLRR